MEIVSLMYIDFYNFREMPFSLTPDPRFLVLSKVHREAFAHLFYGIQNRSGFIALTGEAGSGKTMILHALLAQFAPNHFHTALISNPSRSALELLSSINREFGIPSQDSNARILMEALNTFLIQENTKGRIVVLGIDDVQNLNSSVLERIRFISNLETTRAKLIQIVLSGRPEFLKKMNEKDMQPLSQRIAVHYHLGPMDFQDTVDYINRRIEVAGRRGGRVFSKGALRRIHRNSRGLPQFVNTTCHSILTGGYTLRKKKITSRIASAEIKNMNGGSATHSRRRRLMLILTSGLTMILLVAGIFFAWRDASDWFKGSAPHGVDERAIKKYPLPTGEKVSWDLAVERGKFSKGESLRKPFNPSAPLRKGGVVPVGGNWNRLEYMERKARDWDLCPYRFPASIHGLLGLEDPVAGGPNLSEPVRKRFISLAGPAKEKLLISTLVVGKKFLFSRQLENHETGGGFLIWKDPLNLQAGKFPAAGGNPIRQLLGVPEGSGAYTGESTGPYGGNFLSVDKRVQAATGIRPDGIAGSQPLMHLYRSLYPFEWPKLAGGGR